MILSKQYPLKFKYFKMLLSANDSSIVSDVIRVNDEDIDCGEEDEVGSTKDGLADMMQRILHQHVEPSVSSEDIRSPLPRVYSRIDRVYSRIDSL